MAGDCCETLLYLNGGTGELLSYLAAALPDADAIRLVGGAAGPMIEIKARRFPDDDLLADLRARFDIRQVQRIAPVLPVLASKHVNVPFITCEEMLRYNEGRGLALWELALHYESARGGLSHHEVFDRMNELVGIMLASIQAGLAGTRYADRILGCQSANYRLQMEGGRLLDAGLLNRIDLLSTHFCLQLVGKPDSFFGGGSMHDGDVSLAGPVSIGQHKLFESRQSLFLRALLFVRADESITFVVHQKEHFSCKK